MNKTKLILLFIGLIIIISCLAGFVAYYDPIFLYGSTLGLMAFIYGFFHEDKETNASNHYIMTMSSVFVLQMIILVGFFYKFSLDDVTIALTFSLFLISYFFVENVRIVNKRKIWLFWISVIIIFIAIVGFLAFG